MCVARANDFLEAELIVGTIDSDPQWNQRGIEAEGNGAVEAGVSGVRKVAHWKSRTSGYAKLDRLDDRRHLSPRLDRKRDERDASEGCCKNGTIQSNSWFVDASGSAGARP